MSGRGRGKRPGGGLGPGRPPKYPNLSNNGPARDDTASPETAGTDTSNGSGGGLVDILNQLDANKRNQMLSLVGQYKNRGLTLNDFMVRSRDLLGERLYSQLARDMSNAAAARGVASSSVGASASTTINTNNPMMPAVTTQMRPIPAQLPMHSMPQIYAHPSSYPNLSSAVSSSGTLLHHPQYQNYNNTHTVEVDVSKMDTSSLQDVIQYSGVDLKAEAELLYREHDNNNNNNLMSTGSLSVDHRLKFDYFFNPFKFRAIVQHALQRHFFAFTLQSNLPSSSSANSSDSSHKLTKPLGITEEAVHLLGIAIQKRLIGILRRLAEISRHRVDYGRGRFKIKIENDPKKQIWLQEKLFIEGIGEDKRRSLTGPNGTANTSITTSNTISTNQTLLNPPSLASLNAKAASSSTAAVSSSKATAASTAAAAAAVTDESVKTKLANVTAMAALGIRQKSWMSSATAVPSTTATSTGATGASGTSANPSTAPSSNSNDSSANPDDKDSQTSHPLANFYSLPSSTPLTDSELKAQYYNRTISTVDLITCMESDSHLRRSRLLAVLYESLPRENKSNNTNPSE